MREVTNASATAHHAGKLAEAMMSLERRLESRAYLAGDEFTVGDIPLGIVTYRWRLLDSDRPSMPNVERWSDHLMRRPAFRKTVCPPEETNTPLRSDPV